LLKVPDGQRTHEVDPTGELYVPMGHALTQDVAPAALKEPIGQLTHADELADQR
jgi:hypothetical protein